MWSNLPLLRVRVRSGGFRLWLPVPLWVLDDTLASAEDLCEIVLPRLGLPNYATAARTLLRALEDPDGEPLVDVSAGDVDVRVSCGPAPWQPESTYEREGERE